MEKFTINAGRPESLSEEIIRHTKSFVQDGRVLLGLDITEIEMLSKLIETIATTRDLLLKIDSKDDSEYEQIKSLLLDLDDLEKVASERKIVH